MSSRRYLLDQTRRRSASSSSRYPRSRNCVLASSRRLQPSFRISMSISVARLRLRPARRPAAPRSRQAGPLRVPAPEPGRPGSGPRSSSVLQVGQLFCRSDRTDCRRRCAGQRSLRSGWRSGRGACSAGRTLIGLAFRPRLKKVAPGRASVP